MTMNRKELDALIGLDLFEAEKIVSSVGLKAWSVEQNSPRIARSLPGNVVMLDYNKNHIIVRAENQTSIDSKYCK